ncbi:MAG TPA: hypothetical protein VJV05_03135 [Pyrinomonadaceae bacterium]|nr:hypothetical protein [Pyrinomonadaceae bacterium]
MRQILFSIGIALLLGGIGYAQPRPLESSKSTKQADVAPAPETFAAKYEGGMFGYSKKEEGIVRFDDENERLVFIGQDQQEKFHIPYHSILVIYPQSKSVTSTAGTVVGAVAGGAIGNLIKEKRQYLIVHFDDPDIEAAKGIVNFKLSNKELLDSVLIGLAEKASLVQRGDAYYRPKKPAPRRL